MRKQIKQYAILLLLAVATAAGGAGCASNHGGGKQAAGRRVSLTELSDPARATVNRVTAGGQVDKIEKEVERGKVVYDVEATVGGQHVEFLIGDADGAVLGTETSIEYRELPEAVRVAAEKYFDRAKPLKAMKGVEYGETSYEIEGPRKGKTVEVTFDPAGKRLP